MVAVGSTLGSGGIKVAEVTIPTAEVTIPTAEVLTLNGTPVVVVPAPGVGRANIVLNAAITVSVATGNPATGDSPVTVTVPYTTVNL